METDLLRPISLEDLDERAGLLRRVDRKYVVEPEQLTQLIERLGADHDVLEIDGASSPTTPSTSTPPTCAASASTART